MRRLLPSKENNRIIKLWKLSWWFSTIYLTIGSFMWNLKKFDYVLILFVAVSFVHFLTQE